LTLEGGATYVRAMAKITRKNIDKELGVQLGDGAELPAEVVRDVLAQTATGVLNASLGAPGIPQEKVREQILAHVVYAYTQRPDPRDVHASMMPKLVANLLQQKGAPKQSKETVDTLGRVATGFLREGQHPLPAAAKLIVVRGVVDYFLAGA